ncbi:conserved hypothetical protein [Methanosalsum zhilinae DSM 4017]|uniref:Uncharacterized protein n=1 Tax=Methanosalsum zhilinae (strain DSM 4017 / NBRC 107636 / OCM 62 / WeN5) TaxID=679901 RepID=F7XN73_METZD|nr:hypothetical protein [Methanosalsum zhilinae]AEH60030.1 conserved hypothetical protein [Methanosalsum zhilinae DSM 4017]
MEDLRKLQDMMEKMKPFEVGEYVQENYPDNPELWSGSKKIVVRKIINFERDRMEGK